MQWPQICSYANLQLHYYFATCAFTNGWVNVSWFMANDALVRWEEIRRQHLGGAIALSFGISSASLAFCGSLLTQNSVTLGGERTTYFLWAVVFFIAAVVVSLLVILTRLQDIRITVNIVRKREDAEAKQDDAQTKAEIKLLRRRARCWGKLTWWLIKSELKRLKPI